MRVQPGSSRVEAASAAIKGLRSGKFPTLQAGPGSASTIRDIGADELSSMSWAQLRKLANQTVGITQKRKNKKGKWVPKRSKELKEELLALKKVASAQAVPGRRRSSTACT